MNVDIRNKDIRSTVQQIARKARRMSWLSAAGILLASLVGVLIVAVLLDFACRHLDSGMRYLIFAGCAAVAAAVLYRFSRTVRDTHFSEVEVARLIERHLPGHSDQLSSAVSFLIRRDQLANRSDTTTGVTPAVSDDGQSRFMQQAVIADANQSLTELDPRSVLDYGPFVRSLVIAAIATAIVAAALLMNASAVRIGLNRVIAPWSSVQWPRINDLYFVNQVEQMAIGADFVGEIRDRNNRLPAEATFEFAFSVGDSATDYSTADNSNTDVDTSIQSRKISRLDDTLIVRLENITRSFRYRVTGGDHTTRWFDMSVSPAPVYKDLAITVMPPSHFGIQPHTFHDDNIRAIAGSTFTLTATANEAVQDADVLRQQQGETVRHPALIDSDGLSIRYPTERITASVDQSESMNLVIRNLRNVIGGTDRTIRFEVLADREPVVDLVSSTGASTTARGELDLQVSVSEDVRLDRVELICLIPESERKTKAAADSILASLAGQFPGEDAIPLPLFSRSDETGEIIDVGEYGFGQRFESRTTVLMEQFGQLEFGDAVAVIAYARDASGLIGKSNRIEFRIRTPGELLDDLMRKQNEIHAQLALALRRQQAASEQAGSLQQRQQEPNPNRDRIVADLRTVRATQSGVKSLLVGPAGSANEVDQPSVKAKLAEVLLKLQTNSIHQPEFEAHLHGIHEVLESLGDGPLETVGFQLADVQKTLETDEPTADTPQTLFESARGSQQEIIARLEELVGRFSHIDQLQKMVATWTGIRDLQNGILQRTTETRNELAGVPISGFSENAKQRLRGISEGQVEIASQAQRASWELQQLAAAIDTNAPGSNSIRRGADLLNQAQIDSQMRMAATAVAANKPGKATSLQRQSLKNVDQLLRILRGDQDLVPASDLERESASREEAAELAELQQSVTQSIKEAELKSDDASNALQEAAENQNEVVRRLELLKEQLSKQRQQASGKVDQTLDKSLDSAEETLRIIQEGETPNARASSERTESLLNELTKQMDRRVDREQRRQVSKEIDQAAAMLEELISQQQSIIGEYRSDLTRNGMLKLAKAESQLADVTTDLASRFDEQIAIQFALKQAAELMNISAEQLNQSGENDIADTKDAVPIADTMQIALEQLTMVREALSEQGTNRDEEPLDQTDEGTPEETDQRRSGISSADLRLLIKSQQLILQETAELDAVRAETEGEWTELQRRQIDQLRSRESQLQEIISSYARRMANQQADSATLDDSNSGDDADQVPKLPLPALPGFE